ncbi:MAG: hypothetical protein V4550_14435 [Gemmatimonadota bacterium]
MNARRRNALRRIAVVARRRTGFALPLTILVIAALTATLAAAFASVSAEIATNSAQRSESRAFALAESGLEEYISRRAYHCTARTGYVSGTNFVCGGVPDVDSEYVRVSLPGGYADVTAKRVQKALGTTRPAAYLIRSRGVDTVAPFNGATRSVYGERIVAQYVQWSMKTIQVLSGWTSLTGLLLNGASATVSGTDHCNPSNIIAGVALPDGTLDDPHGDVSGNPVKLEMGTQAAMAPQVKIDWAGITTETSMTPGYSIADGGSIPSAALADATMWPVIHVKNFNYTTHTSGSTFVIPDGFGLLIIDGDARVNGSDQWDGIVLAGGTLTSNGSNNIYGATITGLNVKLGETVPVSDVGNGSKVIQYDSCNVAKAASGLGFFSVFPNAWMDNYTTY